MLLGSVTASFRHGLVIVAAPETTDTHDEWDTRTERMHAGPDSLYISVRPAATGLVTVSVHDNDGTPEGLILMHSGRLTLPSASLMVEDPEETVRLIAPVESNDVGIELYCDDVEEPSVLAVRVLPGAKE